MPLNRLVPEPQTIQSLLVPPVHVVHKELQGEHVDPLENDPSGQTCPVLVAEVGGLHWVESVDESVKPDLHAVHVPVDDEHVSHPMLHTMSE